MATGRILLQLSFMKCIAIPRMWPRLTKARGITAVVRLTLL
jgi:hypothetical protein